MKKSRFTTEQTVVFIAQAEALTGRSYRDRIVEGAAEAHVRNTVASITVEMALTKWTSCSNGGARLIAVEEKSGAVSGESRDLKALQNNFCDHLHLLTDDNGIPFAKFLYRSAEHRL